MVYTFFPFSFLQFVVLEEHQDPKNGSLSVAGTNDPAVDTGLSSNLQPGEYLSLPWSRVFPNEKCQIVTKRPLALSELSEHVVWHAMWFREMHLTVLPSYVKILSTPTPGTLQSARSLRVSTRDSAPSCELGMAAGQTSCCKHSFPGGGNGSPETGSWCWWECSYWWKLSQALSWGGQNILGLLGASPQPDSWLSESPARPLKDHEIEPSSQALPNSICFV